MDKNTLLFFAAAPFFSEMYELIFFGEKRATNILNSDILWLFSLLADNSLFGLLLRCTLRSLGWFWIVFLGIKKVWNAGLENYRERGDTVCDMMIPNLLTFLSSPSCVCCWSRKLPTVSVNKISHHTWRENSTKSKSKTTIVVLGREIPFTLFSKKESSPIPIRSFFSLEVCS